MKNIILLIFFFTLPVCCFTQETTEIEDLVKTGNNLINTGDYNSALKEFEKALTINPNYDPAVSGKIDALTFLDEYNDALKLVEEALGKNPGYADFFYNRGMISNYKKQYKKAIEDFSKALELGNATDNNRIYLNRGAARQKLEIYDDALEDYSKAIELNPNNPNTFIYRGYLNYSLGKFTEAVEDYTRALNIDQNNPYSYYNKGMSHYKLNDMDKACIDFHKSCKLGNMNACKMIVSYCIETSK